MKTIQTKALVRGRGIGAPTNDGPHTQEDGRGLHEAFDVDKEMFVCFHCGDLPHRLDLDTFDTGGVTEVSIHSGIFPIEEFDEILRLMRCGAQRWNARWNSAFLRQGKYKYGWRLCYDGWVIPHDSLIHSEQDIYKELQTKLENFKDSLTISQLDHIEDLYLKERSTPKRLPSPMVRDEDEEGRQEERNVRRCLSPELEVEVQECEHNKW